MSSQGRTHQTSINTYSKCIYFLPTCREAGRVDNLKNIFVFSRRHTLEAFNNFREDFQKSLQKQREVDQSLEVEFAPELQISHLDSYSSRLVDDAGQGRSSAEDPSKVASTSPKQYSHSSRQYRKG